MRDSILKCITTITMIFLVQGVWGQNSSEKEPVEGEPGQLEMPIDEAIETKAMDPIKEVDSGKDVEKLEVIGSHIKRINIEGPSPVMILDREDLNRSGYNSVSDVLRDTTVNSFGSTKEASGSNAAGVAHVNLRGLGSGRTLVLLNGKRLSSDAVTGAVDLNLIPMAAVQRIEILKDGASALYGSDALGGVVNIVTYKDFSGTEMSVQQSLTEMPGGKKLEVSAVNGISSSRFNIVNVVHYRKNDTIFSRDREWSREGYSLTGSPGSYRIVNPDGSKSAWMADPQCPASDIIVSDGNSFCKFNYPQYSTDLPGLEQISLMTEGNVEVGPDWTLNGRLSLVEKNNQWQYAPSPAPPLRVPSDVASNIAGVPSGSAADIRYRTVELGNRVSEIKTHAASVGVGAKSGFGLWEVEFGTNYNVVKRDDMGVSGYALEDKLKDAIISGSVNLLAPEGQRGDLSGVSYEPWQKSTSDVFSMDAKISGEIGMAGVALGVGATSENYKDEFDEETEKQNVLGSAGSSGGGGRKTQSLFGEVSIPASSIVEVQIAGRHDQFSDFGSTTNPKLAVRIQPHPTTLIRTSVGTGFKAPLLVDMYAADSFGYPTFTDAVMCEKVKSTNPDSLYCLPQQYLVQSGGNPNLKEEKSVSANIGVMFEPSGKTPVGSLNMGFDFWGTKLTNVVDIDYNDIMQAELAGHNLAATGVIIDRDQDGSIN